MTRKIVIVISLITWCFATTALLAGGKAGFHCEIKKDGKHEDLMDVKTKKQCKEKKGEWVKNHDHDHDHDHGDHDHAH